MCFWLWLVRQHNLQPHLYADDTHIYGFCTLISTTQTVCLPASTMLRPRCGPIGCSSTLPRRRSCGSRCLAASIISRTIGWWSAPTPSYRPSPFETSVFTLSPICRWRFMFTGQCQTASHHCVRSAAYAGRSRGRFCSRWWHQSFSHDWITALQRWLDCQTISWTGCSPHRR